MTALFKKTLAIASLLALLLPLTALFCGLPAAAAVTYGDANADGTVDARDFVLLVSRFSRGVGSLMAGADCNGDGKMTVEDAVLLRAYFAGMDYASGVSPVNLGPKPEETTVPETADPTGTEPGKEPEDGPHDRSEIVPASNQFIIIYELNGGSLGSAFASKDTVADAATGKIVVRSMGDFFYQTVTDSAYLCPHSMGDKNYLTRPGYVLTGYNTAADGSGEYFACGWNVPITKGQKIVLYAQWAKESDASLFSFSSGKITGYSGNEDTVVVPASIKGTAVTEISSRAFSGKKMKTVILPKSVTKLSSSAFTNCSELEKVVLSDLVTSLPSDTFSGCAKMTTLVFNNANSVKYVGAQKEGMYHMKFQRLLLNRDKKKIVIISGSNAVYGILSPVMEEKLGGEYTVINYGTNFYVPSALYVEAVSHFVGPGDIVVTTPEEVPQQWGDIGTSGKAQFWPAIEGCMEIISCLNIQNYTAWLPELANMNAKRAGGSKSYESVYSEAVDSNGEFGYERTAQTAKFSNTSYSDWFGSDVRQQCFSASNTANLNRSFDLCVARGAKIYISFSVCDKSYVSDTSNANLSAYEQAARNAFVNGRQGRAVISRVSTYLFDHECFYNSMHHLLSAPSRTRSELLAADILAQLAKEK